MHRGRGEPELRPSSSLLANILNEGEYGKQPDSSFDQLTSSRHLGCSGARAQLFQDSCLQHSPLIGVLRIDFPAQKQLPASNTHGITKITAHLPIHDRCRDAKIPTSFQLIPYPPLKALVRRYSSRRPLMKLTNLCLRVANLGVS